VESIITGPGTKARGGILIGVTLEALLCLLASAAFAQDNLQGPPPDSMQQGGAQQERQAPPPEPPQDGIPQQQPQTFPPETPQQIFPQQPPQPQQYPKQSVPLPSHRRSPRPDNEPDYNTPRLLVGGYVGFATPVASMSDHYDTCLRIGIFLGWQLSRNLSLNLELTHDSLKPRLSQNDYALENVAMDFSFSPLYHLPLGYANLDIVTGPKLGFFNKFASSWSDGWLVGANVGVLVVMGGAALGVLFSYTGRHYSSLCPAGSADSGGDCLDQMRSIMLQTVSLNGVILF